MLQRISHRIIALIAIAMAGLLITGINSLTQVARLSADIRDLSGNVIPSIELIDDAEIAFFSARGHMLSHVIEQDPDKKQKLETQLTEDIQRVHKALKDYEPYLLGEEGKQLLDASRNSFAEYLKVLEQVLAYSRTNDTTSSMAIASTKLRDAAETTVAAMERHAKYNHDDALKTQGLAEATVVSAKWMAIGVVLVSVLLLLWVAYSTYQRVVGTAQRARTEVIRVVEQLDFSRPLPAEGKDELAELLQALNRLITRLREGLGSVRSNADHLNRSAEELALASRQVTASSSAQSDAASTMAASVEQVTVSINHVSDRIGPAKRVVSPARVAIRRWVGVMPSHVPRNVSAPSRAWSMRRQRNWRAWKKVVARSVRWSA